MSSTLVYYYSLAGMPSDIRLHIHWGDSHGQATNPVIWSPAWYKNESNLFELHRISLAIISMNLSYKKVRSHNSTSELHPASRTRADLDKKHCWMCMKRQWNQKTSQYLLSSPQHQRFSAQHSISTSQSGLTNPHRQNIHNKDFSYFIFFIGFCWEVSRPPTPMLLPSCCCYQGLRKTWPPLVHKTVGEGEEQGYQWHDRARINIKL